MPKTTAATPARMGAPAARKPSPGARKSSPGGSKSSPAGSKAPRRRQPVPRVRSEAAEQRRRRQVEDRRSVILTAALGLFSRLGLHGTSLEEVAARADVSKSNLLYYFASKEALYVCVIRELLHVWLEPLRGFSAQQDPREAIGGYIRRKLASSRDDPDASRLFCLEIIRGAPLLRDDLGSELRDQVDLTSQVIRDWVQAGKLAPVDPHHLIFALWAVTQHYADFAVQVHAITGRTLDDPVFFEQTVENVQRIVLQGVLVDNASQAPFDATA